MESLLTDYELAYNNNELENYMASLQSTLLNQVNLQILNPRHYSLLYAHVLFERILSSTSMDLVPQLVLFCSQYSPEQWKVCPILWKKSVNVFRHLERNLSLGQDMKWSLYPLSLFLRKWESVQENCLNPLCSLFLEYCLVYSHVKLGSICVQSIPTSFVMDHVDDLDILKYYYYGALIHLSLRKYSLCLEFLKSVLTVPSTVPSAIQIEAYKKFLLIFFICNGESTECKSTLDSMETKSVLPKYTSSVVLKACKYVFLYLF